MHVNRMVFGAAVESSAEDGHASHEAHVRSRLPFSCALALLLAAVPVLVLGVYVPEPLHRLLTMAATAVSR
jgi:hypothetical protein